MSYLYKHSTECAKSGNHLSDCDNDGYCNLCGYQDSVEDILREKMYFGNAEMHLTEIGLKMQNWHSAMMDPVYMVGSVFFSGEHYDDLFIVARAKMNLENDLSKCGLDRKRRRILARRGYKNRIGAESTPMQFINNIGYEDQQELADLIDCLDDYLKHFQYKVEE